MSTTLFAKQSLALATRVCPQYAAGMEIFSDGFSASAFVRYNTPDKFHSTYVEGMHRLNPFLSANGGNICPHVATLSSRLSDSVEGRCYRQFMADYGFSDMVVMSFKETEGRPEDLGWLAYLIPRSARVEDVTAVMTLANNLYPYIRYNLSLCLAASTSSRVTQTIASMNLSIREAEVALLVGMGLCNKDIASRLKLAVPTVKSHITRILSQAGMKNRNQLIGLLKS